MADPFGSSPTWRDAAAWARRNPDITLAIIAAAIVLGALYTMIYQVERDEQAVVTRFGAYDRTEGPGLHFKLPDPFERVHIVNTLRVFEKEFGFRSADNRATRARYDVEAFMLTGDLGIARVEWVVQYRRAEPRDHVFNVRDEDRLVRDASEEAVRRIIGDFDAVDVITVARVEIARSVHRELQAIMEKYNSGIIIDDLLIQHTEPPEAVAPAFREVDEARQDRERLRLEAEAVQERVIPEARGEAERIIAEARGNAAQFLEVMREYHEFPEVTRTRLFLERMETVLARSDRVFIVDDDVRSLLPLLELQQEH